jgi:hypothetical protein
MKLKQTLLIGLFLFGLVAVVVPQTAYAASCAGVTTSIIDCSQTGGADIKDTGVWGILLLSINILTAGIGIAAIGGIVYGSILYTSAGGSAEQTKKAMGIITNVVIGIIAYALMYAFLNFIIPGGLFVP